MNHKKWFVLGGIILFIVTILIIYIFNNTNNVTNSDTKIEQSQNKKIYKHAFPERISKTDYFAWQFISNDTASVYPRRNALVKDILVDIWDEVKVWDTLAILFTPWVSWEWSSKINLKSTLVSTKTNLLEDIINVKNAKISEIDTKILEKEIIIDETIKNFNSQISQLKTLITNKWKVEDNSLDNQLNKIEIEKRNLETLEINLKNLKIQEEQKIINSKDNIKQKEDLFESKIDEVYNNIIPIFYIWNETEIDYKRVNSQDLSDVFGAKNSIIKNTLLTKLREFENQKSILANEDKYKLLREINSLLIQTLKNTIISVQIEESNISNSIAKVDWYNNVLLVSKENYHDAINNYNILIASEEKEIKNLESNIEKQKQVITLTLSSYDLVNLWKNELIENLELELKKLNSSKSLQINKLKAELETIKKSKNLLEASENKWITSIENEIAIAKAGLNNEYIKSWDYKIISPFEWIISKRWIEIGGKTSLSLEAFRISGVETSLSKVTKKEIKFYVPETLKEDLWLNKEIKFSLWNNKNKSFTGIIYRISPEIDEKTFSITVQAKVRDDILLPNKSTIRVSLENKEDIYKIPTWSIYNKGSRKIIYYKKDNWKLGVLDINIISDDGEFSLISGKIDEKTKVVTTPIFIK